MLDFGLQFYAAKGFYEACAETIEDIRDRLDSPGYSVFMDNWKRAVDNLLRTPSGTLAGLAYKRGLIAELGLTEAENWSEIQQALEADMRELQRPCATLHYQFEAWREAHFAHATWDGPDEQADELCVVAGAACTRLLNAPCASPGDFMLKTYVALLVEFGPSASGGPAGNLWDVDIAQADHPTHTDDEWKRSAYRDLDECDLGACLLAFGRLDFSASDWVDRAIACDLKSEIGETSIVVAMYDPDCDEAIQRERNRLRRLINFNDGRYKAVMEEMRSRHEVMKCKRTHPEPAA